MKTYTIRLIDPRGRLTDSKTMQCVNDDDAIECAATFAHRQAIEVWDEQRLVWRFDAVRDYAGRASAGSGPPPTTG